MSYEFQCDGCEKLSETVEKLKQKVEWLEHIVKTGLTTYVENADPVGS